MDEGYKATLERAVRYLCNGADAVCADMMLKRGVPRFNYMTGGYTWDDDYVWDSWANFQWVGFLTGRLWLLHLMTHDQRYADAALQLCERIGPVLARHATVFSSTGIDMYYALTLGYQITKCDSLKEWTFAGGDNFANIFDRKANAFSSDCQCGPYRHRYRTQSSVDAVGVAMGARAGRPGVPPPRHRP